MLRHRHVTHRRARLAFGAVLVVASAVVLTFSAPSGVARALTEPQLVADVHTDGAGSGPSHLTAVDDRLFLTADDGVHGRELWVTDGIAAPVMVADIRPGESSASPEHLFGWNGVLYFSAYEDGVGRELWRSDGTPAGTYRLAETRAGISGGDPGEFTIYAGAIYFVASGQNGRELWRTDGTPAGTLEAVDLRPGVLGSSPHDLTVVDHGPGDRRLWLIADTTGSSTADLVVYDAPEGASADPPQTVITDSVHDIAAYAGDLYAAAGYPVRTLHRVERTALGPPAVYTASSLGGVAVSGLTRVAGRLFLTSDDTATGRELHVLDGNSIDLVLDINPGSANSSPSDLVASGDDVYFSATNAATGMELWRTDGTPSGTAQVGDIAPGTAFAYPTILAAADGGVVFSADDDGAVGMELWFARASTNTLFLLADTFPGPTGTYPGGTAVVLADQLYVTANDQLHGSELLRLDVTGPLTQGATDLEVFGDIRPGTTGAWPWSVAAVGDSVAFVADDSEHGSEVRVFTPSNGATTTLDLAPGPLGSDPDALVPLGAVAVFSAEVDGDAELWVTDGSPAGTTLIDLDVSSDAEPSDIVRAGAHAYFVAETTAAGRELWRTDGTPAGTTMVADLRPGAADADIHYVTAFGERVLFVHDDTLWMSDGTPGGTGAVATGSAAPYFPYDLVATPTLAVFAAEDSGHSGEYTVWRSDGTEGGIFPLTGIAGGDVRSPFGFAWSGDRAYFSAYPAGSGPAAYTTDGTVAGTVALTGPDVEADTYSFAALPGGGGAFQGNDPDAGYELWVSDGTPAGTRRHDIVAGTGSSQPYEFAAHRGWAYFTASTPDAGAEMWRTDGVAVERVTDMVPGPGDGLDAYASPKFSVGTDLYAVADNGVTGAELWWFAGEPFAATGVTAAAGVAAATVSWMAADASPAAPVSGYTATATPGGATCSTTAVTCTVTGLSPGLAYTFTVVADSSAGPSAPSAPSNAVVPTAPGVGGAVAPVTPIEPARFLDTRAEPTFDGQQAGVGRLSAGAVLRVPVAGRGSVPAGATGVVANLTVVSPDAPGHATLFPCTPQPPNASHLNYLPGDVLADNAVVPLDAGGGVCIYTRAAGDYVLDVNGFVGAGSPLVGVEPARYLDTRTEPKATTFDGTHQGTGAVPAEQTIEVAIAGRGAVPNGATAAFVTVTAVAPDGPGYLTLYPCDTRPHASNLNYAAGEVVPNGAVVELSPTGTLCVFTKATAHVLVDVAGYLPAGAAGLTAAAPQRLLDTRPGGPTVDGANSGSPGRLAAEQVIEIQVAGRGSIPAGATAALLNVGLVGPDAAGYATLYPCGPRPTASNVNAIVPGSVRANNALTKLSPAGTVCIFVKAATDVILDATGWIEPNEPGDPGDPADPPADPGAACARTTSLPQPGDTTVDLVLTGRVLGPDGLPVPDGGGFVAVVDRRSSVGAHLGEASVNDAGFFLVIIGSNAIPADTNCRDYWLEVCAPGSCATTGGSATLEAELDITDLIGGAAGQGRQDVDISDDELTYSEVE